jgi:hypothetical protein
MASGLDLAKPAADRTCAALFDRCMIRFATVGSSCTPAASCKRYCPLGDRSQDELLSNGKAAGGARERESSVTIGADRHA